MIHEVWIMPHLKLGLVLSMEHSVKNAKKIPFYIKPYSNESSPYIYQNENLKLKCPNTVCLLNFLNLNIIIFNLSYKSLFLNFEILFFKENSCSLILFQNFSKYFNLIVRWYETITHMKDWRRHINIYWMLFHF